MTETEFLTVGDLPDTEALDSAFEAIFQEKQDGKLFHDVYAQTEHEVDWCPETRCICGDCGDSDED